MHRTWLKKEGVLPTPERSGNGYRVYSQSAVDRLAFVKDAQATGLSLDEIGAVLGVLFGEVVLEGAGGGCPFE